VDSSVDHKVRVKFPQTNAPPYPKSKEFFFQSFQNPLNLSQADWNREALMWLADGDLLTCDAAKLRLTEIGEDSKCAIPIRSPQSCKRLMPWSAG
jgi:hypothetical protein